MNWTEQRRAFRTILETPRCVFPASVFDPLSARIAQDLGFEAGLMAGSVASMAVLGAPDLTVLTLSEFADQAYRICRAGKLPLMVDADHGYGNALNVKRTVEELETAGVAALSIEDTLLPQPFGASEEPHLIPIEEGIGKMRAAIAGRQDPDLVIVARSSAIQIAGLEAAVERARAYQSAGVDVLHFAGIKTRAELDAVSAATTLPIVVGNSWHDIDDLDYLAERRVRVCQRGHRPLMAAIQAVYETMQGLRIGAASSAMPKAASPELVRQLTHQDDFERWTKDFLGT
jgi:carboxyvinyl-carboxyphosphonate phosphorylmutase